MGHSSRYEQESFGDLVSDASRIADQLEAKGFIVPAECLRAQLSAIEALRNDNRFLTDQIKQYGTLDSEFVKFSLACGFGRIEMLSKLRVMIDAADCLAMIDDDDEEVIFVLGTDAIEAIKKAKGK